MFPQPGSVASWVLLTLLNQWDLSQHGLFLSFQLTLLRDQLLSHRRFQDDAQTYSSAQLLTCDISHRSSSNGVISPFYTMILPTARLYIINNSQGPGASSLGIIAELTFIKVLNNFTQPLQSNMLNIYHAQLSELNIQKSLNTVTISYHDSSTDNS